ncbi:Ig heavy chain V region VH558 A1/A4 [Myotis brandtii]|uniref:Ig heavy chain V region VH558 A1/A4 n=1 Tax=Myotis brandtii TaxID=109478 RepID=S7MPA9_MYOBR|nr:Ig heavy chain V region VH558 A1/A4 [Myotis brandtii]
MSGYSFTLHWLHWVCQMPGKGLEWMGWIWPGDGDARYNPSFKGHVTISRDNSTSTGYLQWSSLKASDMVVYYCARDTARETTSRGHQNPPPVQGRCLAPPLGTPQIRPRRKQCLLCPQG